MDYRTNMAHILKVVGFDRDAGARRRLLPVHNMCFDDLLCDVRSLSGADAVKTLKPYRAHHVRHPSAGGSGAFGGAGDAGATRAALERRLSASGRRSFG
jgi:hypothetical protein